VGPKARRPAALGPVSSVCPTDQPNSAAPLTGCFLPTETPFGSVRIRLTPGTPLSGTGFAEKHGFTLILLAKGLMMIDFARTVTPDRGPVTPELPDFYAVRGKCAQKRLVIVVRADPVICGHSGEARHLAETAIRSGFSEVKILTWPIETLQKAGLPLKPLDTIAPYSDGITVERPPAVGDYKVPDGRLTLALKGRLVELFTDGVPTVCLSLYLVPHTQIVTEAVAAARSTGLPVDVTTIAEAVGSDITNVVRSCVEEGRMGPAMYLFSTYLASDRCVAVSAYTRDLIVQAAQEVDAACGTAFAVQCRERVTISYPAMDAQALGGVLPPAADAAIERRGLTRGGYALFLSRVTPAKGVDDLIRAYQASEAKGSVRLVIAGTGPALPEYRALAAGDPDILFFDDVDDEEKPLLMHGAAAYVLPSKPRPEFVETFGIALAEKMLVGGEGPVITTATGGIPEAVGDTHLPIEAGNIPSITAALDHAVLGMTREEKQKNVDAARAFAMQFDRTNVFANLLGEFVAVGKAV